MVQALVIGTGQGGVPLAKALAKRGWETVIVESGEVGGTCINYGCTPTKTMVASAKVAYLCRHAQEYGVSAKDVSVHLEEVIARKNEIVTSFRSGSEKHLQETDHVRLVRGTASFVDSHAVRVSGKDGEEIIRAEKIFINTGGVPVVPAIPGLNRIAFLQSPSIMELTTIPEHLLILGGGYIGLEFGQMFCRFGSRVTVIHRGKTLLSREDPDVGEAMQKILEKEGMAFRCGTTVEEFVQKGTSIQATLSSGEGLEGSHVLVAIGRKPNIESLNLKEAGITTDERGFIAVNAQLETNISGVYAMGDVKGGPAFTHISYDDYRVLESVLFGGERKGYPGRLVPYTLFTDPQLGRVGMTEAEVGKRGIPFRVFRMPMEFVARAIEVGETRGLLKVVVHAETEEILGCAILGIEGGEMMAMIEIAMLGGLRYPVLRDAIFAHPTLAEAFNNLFLE